MRKSKDLLRTESISAGFEGNSFDQFKSSQYALAERVEAVGLHGEPLGKFIEPDVVPLPSCERRGGGESRTRRGPAD